MNCVVKSKQGKRLNPISLFSKYQARKNAMAAKVRNRKKYNVEFTFDCDVDCAITVYLFATEDITTTSANYTPVKPHYR